MNYDKKINQLLNELTYPTGTGGFLPGVSSTEKEDIEAWHQNQQTGSTLSLKILQILDPTGVLSIPDLVYAINEANKNRTFVNISIAALCFICVIPILAYTGKNIKSLLLAGKISMAYKAFDYALVVILGGLVESAGFVSEILNYLDQNQQSQIVSMVKETKDNLSEERLLEISKMMEKYK